MAGYYLYSYTADMMAWGFSNNGVMGSISVYHYASGKSFSGVVTGVEAQGNNTGIIHSQGLMDGAPCTCDLAVQPGNKISVKVTGGPVGVQTPNIFPAASEEVISGSAYVWGDKG